MKSQLYNIYRQCFPSLIIDEKLFLKKINYGVSHIITVKVEGNLIGYSIINRNIILLICVSGQHRRKGFGSRLLEQSEEHIKSIGYDRVLLGYGKNFLFQGVPIDSEDDRISYEFFKKRGYVSYREIVDMTMELDSYSIDSINIQKPMEGVNLRYANNKDKRALGLLVSEVEPSWCDYYKNTEYPILLACLKDEIVGFCILSTDHFFKSSIGDRVGGIGCVGVIPDARGNGIGLYLVAAGTEELKRMGCTTAYISFASSEEWYSKIGYQTYIRFWLGVKKVPMYE